MARLPPGVGMGHKRAPPCLPVPRRSAPGPPASAEPAVTVSPSGSEAQPADSEAAEAAERGAEITDLTRRVVAGAVLAGHDRCRPASMLLAGFGAAYQPRRASRQPPEARLQRPHEHGSPTS